jgi:large conductance mechanosensitive channel
VTADSLAEAKKQGAVLAYGAFLTIVLNFIIVAWALFIAIKAMNRLKSAEPAPPPPGPSKEVQVLTEIRDLLKK